MSDNSLKDRHIIPRSQGPDRRRSRPHPKWIFCGRIKGLWSSELGSRFRADSQARGLISEVRDAVSRWQEVSAEAGVPVRRRIRQAMASDASDRLSAPGRPRRMMAWRMTGGADPNGEGQRPVSTRAPHQPESLYRFSRVSGRSLHVLPLEIKGIPGCGVVVPKNRGNFLVVENAQNVAHFNQRRTGRPLLSMIPSSINDWI